MVEKHKQIVIQSWPHILRERADIERGPFSKREGVALVGGPIALVALGVALEAVGVVAFVTLGSGVIAAVALGVMSYGAFKMWRHSLRVSQHFRDSMETIKTKEREPRMKQVN